MSTTRTRIGTLTLSLAAVLAAGACSGDDDTSTTTGAPESTAAAVTAAATTTETTGATTTEATAAPSSATTAAAATTVAVATTDAVETTAAAEDFVFTSAEGDYTATFPGEPTLQTLPQPLPDGSTYDLVLAGYRGGGAFIATARGKYPDGYALDVPVALQTAQDRALARVQGTLIASQDITLQGRPGREFSASVTTNGQPGTLLTRVYLDGLVIYQQIFTGPGERTFDDPKLTPYFDSFVFTTG